MFFSDIKHFVHSVPTYSDVPVHPVWSCHHTFLSPGLGTGHAAGNLFSLFSFHPESRGSAFGRIYDFVGLQCCNGYMDSKTYPADIPQEKHVSYFYHFNSSLNTVLKER